MYGKSLAGQSGSLVEWHRVSGRDVGHGSAGRLPSRVDRGGRHHKRFHGSLRESENELAGP